MADRVLVMKFARIRCLITGHRWVERKPHRMFDINDYHCARCGATKREGIHITEP